jgi:hypothetical protein
MARTSENSKSDADKQTPTSPCPPQRTPGDMKKALLVTTVNQTLTDQGTRRRITTTTTTTRESMQRQRQHVKEICKLFKR